MADLAKNKMNNPGLVDSLTKLGFKTEDPEGMTFEEAMEASQIASAVRGNLKAYQAITSGKKSKMPLAEFLEEING